MKKLNLIITLLAFLAILSNTYSQNTNNCLNMVLPNEGDCSNFDSVMIDTCYQSPTFGKWFAKRGYTFVMKCHVFGNEALPFETEVTWQDISSTFANIKNGFQNLEQMFESYTIKRSEVLGSRDDSSFLLSPVFELEFQNYYEFDSVSNAIGNIDSTSKASLRFYPILNDIPEIKSTIRDFPFKVIQFNSEILKITFKGEFLFSNNSITIHNLFGQQIFHQNINNREISIDTSKWASGVYIVTIGRYSKLIII